MAGNLSRTITYPAKIQRRTAATDHTEFLVIFPVYLNFLGKDIVLFIGRENKELFVCYFPNFQPARLTTFFNKIDSICEEDALHYRPHSHRGSFTPYARALYIICYGSLFSKFPCASSAYHNIYGRPLCNISLTGVDLLGLMGNGD